MRARGPKTRHWRTCVSRPFWCIDATHTCKKKARSGAFWTPSGTCTQPTGSCRSTTLTSTKSWNVVPALIEIFLGVYDSSSPKSR